MGILDILRRNKQVTDDKKLMSAVIASTDATERGKAPPFSMRSSVNAYQSWAYAAATLNAQGVASIPLRLFVRTDAQESSSKMWRTREVSRSRKAYLLGDSVRKPSISVMKAASMAGDFVEVVDAHPVLELLRKANKVEDGFGLAVTRILFLELCGNAYLHVVTDPLLGIPSELWTLPAQYTTIVASKDELIDGYLCGVNSQSMRRFEIDEVIHFRRPNPRSLYYGMGKVEAAWGAIQLNDSTHEQDYAFSKNMNRPDYAAIIKGGASEASLRRFEESMRSLHQGAQKAGRMVAITGDVQLTPLSFPSKDLSGREEIVEEIAAVFGVPVSMLKANDPNLASATAGYSAWRESCIAPICRLDEETLNARLLPLFGIEEDAYLAYDDAVPANRAADSAERTAAVAGGWRTPNEARLEEGYDEIDEPEADKLHVGGQPLGGMPAAPQFPSFAPMPRSAPEPEPKQLPAPSATPEPIDEPQKAYESSEDREAVLDRAREKIALIEAKAWMQAMQPDTRVDEMEREVELLRTKTKNAERILLEIEGTLNDG